MQPAVSSFEWVRFSTGPGAPDRLGSPLMAKRCFNRWIGAVLPWSAPPLALFDVLVSGEAVLPNAHAADI